MSRFTVYGSRVKEGGLAPASSNPAMQDQKQPQRIIIIGGGITGLAAGHRLLERATEAGRELDVVLLEASSRPGGVLKSYDREGFLIEAGADSFISEKPEAIDLVRRLGIASRLIETNEQHRRSFIVRNGRLLPVPEGFQLLAPSRFWPFVTTDIFSWPGKARMAMDLLIPRRRITNGSDDESLAQFVRRRLGREAFERMAQPMIAGIYTADPEKLSLRATLPRFLEMERVHGSVIRAMWKQRRGSSPTRGPQTGSPAGVGAVKEGSESRLDSQRTYGSLPKKGVSGARYSLFLSFDKGIQVLVDELVKGIANCELRIADSMSEQRILLNTFVEKLAIDRSLKGQRGLPKWKVTTNHNETFEADAVCLAVPAYVAASLLREVDPELARLLDRISYASTATIHLAYQRAEVPHPLDGFGFVVPFVENRSLLACTFSSVKFAGRAPADHVLLRAFVGGALQPDMFELDEDEMVRRVRADLRELLRIETAPLFTVVEKWRSSMPQYHVGHLELVSQIQSQLSGIPGLNLAGNSYAGAGIPDCIRSGEQAADELLDLRFPDGPPSFDRQPDLA